MDGMIKRLIGKRPGCAVGELEEGDMGNGAPIGVPVICVLGGGTFGTIVALVKYFFEGSSMRAL